MWAWRNYAITAGLGGLTASAPITFDRRQWRRQVRTARGLTEAPGAVPLLARGGKITVGATIRSIGHRWHPVFTLPAGACARHMVIVGATGSGKTNLMIRLWTGWFTATQEQARAGPGEPVPVAFVGRTSTLELQDPVASLRRQVRSCQAVLPAGWFIAAWYWDIESGGLDLEHRSQGDAYQRFAAAGIPRDGGMADLLAEAASPLPRFAAVICEDIERSGRDTFNALKLEKKLSRHGIPVFATDEPIVIDGVNATTVLVRRVKQGVAEWFRLQLKEKTWKGLAEHALDGWNIGPAPYGYVAVKVPHPVPVKASQGRSKTRLTLDPDRAPVVEQIFTWRVVHKLGMPTIAARLNADPGRYPPPTPGRGWTTQTVYAVLRNPKYTGHMVYGRVRTRNGHRVTVPADRWLWSPQPAHPPIVSRQT